jgi:TusA-related sulfurtransferase
MQWGWRFATDILRQHARQMMNKMSDFPIPTQTDGNGPEPALIADQIIDISRDICPMTFVRTRLALDRLPKGAVLHVRLCGDEPLRNVPRSAEALGHQVLRLETGADGVSQLWLRRG